MIDLLLPGLYAGMGVGLALPGDGIDQSDFDPLPPLSTGSRGGPSRPLNLPASPEAAIWRAFVDLVTLDPALAGIVAFRSWDGGDGSEQDPDLADGRPWVRMTPHGGPSSRFTNDSIFVPIIVHIDLIVPGTSVVDGFNVFGVLADLIHSDSFRDAMDEAGASDVTIVDPPFGLKPSVPKYEPAVAGAVLSLGTVQIDLYREG